MLRRAPKASIEVTSQNASLPYQTSQSEYRGGEVRLDAPEQNSGQMEMEDMHKLQTALSRISFTCCAPPRVHQPSANAEDA